MGQRPNLRAATVKLLKENIGENLSDLKFNNDFMTMAPKTQATKEKINKLISSKLIIFMLQRIQGIGKAAQ